MGEYRWIFRKISVKNFVDFPRIFSLFHRQKFHRIFAGYFSTFFHTFYTEKPENFSRDYAFEIKGFSFFPRRPRTDDDDEK